MAVKLKDVGTKPSYYWLLRFSASSLRLYWIKNSLDTTDKAQALFYPLEFHIHKASITELQFCLTHLSDDTAVCNDGTLHVDENDKTTETDAVSRFLDGKAVH